MKTTHVILVGLILTLIGFITPQVAPSLDHHFSVIFILFYVVGIAMVIIGGTVRLISRNTNM